MKLWSENGADSAGAQLRFTVDKVVKDINRQAASRGTRAVNAIRNAELRVLKGQRSGRVYRMPNSKATYRASAPGEPPARRTGALRLQWTGDVVGRSNSRGGVTVVAKLESQTPYAGYLEDGTPMTAPRPFVEPIKAKATPEIMKIYNEPYR